MTDWRKRVENDLEWLHRPRDIWSVPRRAEIARGITATSALYAQEHFRVRDDSTALNTDGGWLALDNTDPASIGTGTANRFRIRFVVAETNNAAAAATFKLKVSKQGGAYADVTATSSNVQVTGGLPTDGIACDTQLLPAAAAGSFEADGSYDEGDGTVTGWTHGKKGYAEFEWCVYIVDADVANADTLDFQVTETDDTPFDAYLNTPQITVSKYVPPEIVGSVTVGVAVAAAMSFTFTAALAGAITVAVAVGVTGGVTPDTWNEQFEATGYDEVWSEGETTAGGSTFDEDYATSGVTGDPGDWDTLCAEMVTVVLQDSFIEHRGLGNLTISYSRLEFIVNAESLADGEAVGMLLLRDFAGIDFAEIRAEQTGGTLRCHAILYHDGTANVYSDVISLDTRYRVEVYWDSTNDLYEYRLDGVNKASGSLTGGAVDDSLDRIRLGTKGSGSDAAATVYFDNIGIDATEWIGAAGGSSFEYTSSGVNNYTIAGAVTVSPVVAATMEYTGAAGDYSIVGDVTVGIAVGVTAGITPDTFDEQFETDPGYDETWSDGEIVSGTGVIDEDYPTSSVTGAPADWGDLCLRIVGDATGSARVRNVLTGGSYPIGYFRTEFILKSSDLSGAGDMVFAEGHYEAPDNFFKFMIGDNSGTPELGARLEHDDLPNDTWMDIAFDTRYRIELLWDVTNDIWEYRVDGDTKASGALTGGAENHSGWYRIALGDDGGETDADYEIFIDNVGLDVTEWIGAASAGSSFDFTRNADLTGAVTVGVAVAATMEYTGASGDYSIVGAVPVAVAVAATLDYTRNADLTGTVTVNVTTAATLDYNRNADLTGAVTVAVDPTATALEYLQHPSINGAVTVAVDPTATDLDYTRNADIAGDVTVAITVASAMAFSGASQYSIVGAVPVVITIAGTPDYTLNADLTGAVAVTVDPTASALDYTLNADLTGAITVAVGPTASALQYQQNPSIAGAVTVAVAVASAMDYTLNAAIAGDVTVAVTIASDMAFEAPGQYTITGAVPVAVTIAGAFDYTLNADITGTVTVGVAPTATLAYNRNADITGTVTVSVDPTATALEYNRNASIDGAVTVNIAVASGSDYTLNADLTGDVTVAVTVASGTAYSATGGIIGSVTVTVTPAATLDYTLNADLTGAATVGVTVASGMAYESIGDFQIVGAVTVVVDPTATALDYTRNADITGAITVVVDSTASALNYTSEGSINGSVTVVVDPTASELDYTSTAAIDGAITVTVSPTATTLEYNRNADLTGAVTVTVDPTASLLDYTRNVGLTGDVTVNITVVSGMVFSSANTVTGDITVVVVPAATLLKSKTFDGAVTVTVSPVAGLDYTRNADITGDITVGVSVGSGMEFAKGYTLSGDITVNVLPVATLLDYTQNASIDGSVNVVIAIASPMSYTSFDLIVGDVTVNVLVASFMQQASGVVVTGCVKDEAITTSVAGELTITSVAEFLTNDIC